ncbi:hypothetical protein G6F21_013092 [Rhizopus arrhizus]|nr:hypothetical protein G6F21_013092 [Rhizopus arrhizus]KAG0925729.1 hypothetical protein G6F30_013274 [Rhizopus arrhizus]KAG0926587.1 hypothetical protein G6F32_013166 [Rhizopus arrhizus]
MCKISRRYSNFIKQNSTQQSFLVLSSENSDEDGYNSEVEGNYAAEKRNLSSSQSELDRKTRSEKRVRVRENVPKTHKTLRKVPATQLKKVSRQVTQSIPMEGVEENVIPVVQEKAVIRPNTKEKKVQIRTLVEESPKTSMNSTLQEDLDHGILPGDKIDPADVRHAKVYRCSLAQFENSVTGFRTGLRKLAVKKQTNPRRKPTSKPAHYHAVTRETDEPNQVKKKGTPRTEVIVAGTIVTDAVLDGGSQSTIISLELVKASGIKELSPSRTIHGMADGSDARALGVVPDLTISVQDVIITTRAVVFDHHVYTLLIGSEDLQ